MLFRTFTPRVLRQLGASLISAERTVANSYQLFTVSKHLQSDLPVSAIHTYSDSRKAVSVNVPQSASKTNAIRTAHLCKTGENQQARLIVELSENVRYEFPLVWLRDNCQCSECFHSGSYSRILNWELFDVDAIALRECTVTEDGHRIEIIWKDGHRSQFGSEWLIERNFSEENSQQYLNEWYRPRPRLWSRSEFGEILQHFEFQDVINSDEALEHWIEALIKYGVVMIKNAPLTEWECRKLADRVGFIRKTHYGEEFIVKAKEGTSNVAYLSTPLQIHTDLPYYDYKPGCNLLHCLVQSQSQGGQNLIADAFYVADLIRKKYPQEFKLLSEILVNWTDVGEDEGGQFHSIYRAPVVCIGRDGNLERINHSVPQRDSFFNVPLSSIEPWYRAMALFVKLIHREAVEFKTAPGDILTFSNIRMVHGRTGYTDTDDNTRHIVGAYLDWDEIYSRLRVLKSRLRK
ncbi:gamma-butyrobetaine dioxygenase-like [Topomyia yanbarensis]|uniref:gamma-butyrobetaine dioxygenase-like n=1 Tax=Topomyia yanbarensis TaxID=2498891 RepID=UPI00273A921A|nr:gamma-butyrobetaine dioxygenase-like [Topomyia yanbarensis]